MNATERFDHLFIEPSSFDATVAFYGDGLGWTMHPADDHSKSHGIEGHRPTVHVFVDDLEARHAELAVRGLPLFPPEATHWGTRWFVVRDPDGNLIAYEQRGTAAA